MSNQSLGKSETTIDYWLVETDPTGRNSKDPGAKLDSGKAPLYRGLLDYFPNALPMVAGTSQFGAEKYSWKGWESVPDGINRYSDALVRHLAARSSDTWDHRDDRLLEILGTHNTAIAHQAQVAWNALAVLELMMRENEGTPTV